MQLFSLGRLGRSLGRSLGRHAPSAWGMPSELNNFRTRCMHLLFMECTLQYSVRSVKQCLIESNRITTHEVIKLGALGAWYLGHHAPSHPSDPNMQYFSESTFEELYRILHAYIFLPMGWSTYF
jgi:hypothetical protein